MIARADVAPRCDHEVGCITCGDTAVPMRVVKVDEVRGLALCADAGGARETVETSLVGEVEPGATASRACRRCAPAAGGRGRGGGVRYVDEFRDAELGRALAGEILSAVEPGRHYKLMEVCGGHTHSIYKYGVDDLSARQRGAGPRPGVPRLRDPDGPRRRRHRDRAPPGRDLHLLRRHAAGARLRGHAPRRQGAGRRRADGLLAARRAPDRQAEPRSRRGVLRDRVRDDRSRPPRSR